MKKIKIAQTFWSGVHPPENPLSMKCGWAFPEYNWMSWALSSLLLRRHYDELELYTDEIGKRVLIDMLELPYSKVHVVFDQEFDIHPKLFALAKIKTYSLQDEPFLHIDGDLFLWRKLPEKIIDGAIVASNPEINLHFNKGILDEMESYFEFIPDYLKGVNQDESIFSSNAGIFGGSNLSFIKEYCKNAEQLIARNEKNLKDVNIGNVNMLIEQISLFYLAAQEKVNITYCVTEPVTHPLYKDYWRFADIPEVPMIHPVGGCKRIPYVLHHLGYRLQLEFPDTYYRIIECCVKGHIQLRNRLYNLLDFTGVEKDTELLKTKKFKRAGDQIDLNDFMPDMDAIYARTRLSLEYFNPKEVIEDKNLEIFILEENGNSQLKEILNLETQKLKLFERLAVKIKKTQIYASENEHYKKTTEFVLDDKWTQRSVRLKKDVVLQEVKRPWNLITKENVGEILVEPEKEYFVTLSMNLPSLEIRETYHDQLDAILIRLLRETIRIENLLQILSNSFEDEIHIDDPQYQLLVFDTLKRLAFENIITVFNG